MTLIYLSSAEPRWSPATETDLQDAIDHGLLGETHYLDLKREIQATRAANKELARDMAQFAIDGGTLVVGVEEVAGSAPRLSPIDLDGLSERVEQIAHSNVDPPLQVATTAIASAADPKRGYLLIQVPASGRAPHMVEGTYFGRGDKVRTRLSDPDVRRLHAAQQAGVESARSVLHEYVRRDPIPEETRRQAHLFAVAVPLTPVPEMLLGVINASDASTQLFHLIRDGGALAGGDSFSPHLGYASSLYLRPDGAAMASGLDGSREPQQWDSGRHNESVIEVEFSEDGIIRLMSTRLSYEGPDGRQLLLPIVMPILVRQLMGITGLTASVMGYGGMWMLGVAATGISGLEVAGEHGLFGHNARVDASLEPYERTALASTSEIQQEPGPVAQRLAGRFVRGLGIDQLKSVKEAFD